MTDSIICDERSSYVRRESDLPAQRIPQPRYVQDDPPPEGKGTVVVVIMDEDLNVLGWDAIMRDPRPIWVEGEPGLEFLVPMSIYIRNEGRPWYYSIMGVDDQGRCGLFLKEPVFIEQDDMLYLHHGDAVTFGEPIRVKLHRPPLEFIFAPNPVIVRGSELFAQRDDLDNL